MKADLEREGAFASTDANPGMNIQDQINTLNATTLGDGGIAALS